MWSVDAKETHTVWLLSFADLERGDATGLFGQSHYSWGSRQIICQRHVLIHTWRMDVVNRFYFLLSCSSFGIKQFLSFSKVNLICSLVGGDWIPQIHPPSEILQRLKTLHWFEDLNQIHILTHKITELEYQASFTELQVNIALGKCFLVFIWARFKMGRVSNNCMHWANDDACCC